MSSPKQEACRFFLKAKKTAVVLHRALGYDGGMRFIMTGLLLLVSLPVQAAEDYAGCTQLARTDPAAALKMADEALQARGEPADEHCRAMALYNLQRYEESAVTLERLARRIEQDNRILWVQVMRQSARAREKQGEREPAMEALNRAVAWLSPQAWEQVTAARLLGETLAERAQLYLSRAEPLNALQDLDHAVSLVTDNADILLMRAGVLRRLGDKEGALRDVGAILQRWPQHTGAMMLKSELLTPVAD
jgi:tetratricopeptide (TPR) repeat protein